MPQPFRVPKTPEEINHAIRGKGPKPGDIETMLECAKEGAEITEIAACLGIVRATLYRWADTIPDFRDAFDAARELSAAWWRRTGRQAVFDREFNTPAFRFVASHAHPNEWKEGPAVAVLTGAEFFASLSDDQPTPIDCQVESRDSATLALPVVVENDGE